MLTQKKLIFPFLSLFVGLFVLGVAFAGPEGDSAKETKAGSITGRIMIKDEGPLSEGQIIFFDATSGPPPAPEKYDRTPDISREIDINGRFREEIPEGKYYISAVKRLSGRTIGPLEPGDYFWRGLDEKENYKVYQVKAGEILDIGTISDAIPLKAELISNRAVSTAIEGAVFDIDGNPIPNAVVVAFLNPAVGSKPLFISEKTDKSGKYLLRLTAGTYYLRVRNRFTSGPPEPGQIVGYYGDGSPTPVKVEEGEVRKGINFRVILFPGRGPLSGPPPAK